LLTFKDPEVIRRLQTEFVPVSANTHDLQWRASPAQQFFLDVVAHTTSAQLRRQFSESADPQGMYILGADGTSYGFINDHDPIDVIQFMDRARRSYAQHPPRPIELAQDAVTAPFAETPESDTSVVRVFSRIRPLPAGAWGLNRSVGRDFLWIYRDEVTALLGSCAETTEPGKVALPAGLVRRILRFHLVDNVRGTADMWGRDEVKRAEVSARIVRSDAQGCTLALSGGFALQTADRARGYEGRFEAELTAERASLRVGRFRLYSAGKAWGAGTYTPNQPPGRYDLIIAMTDANEDPIARTVPPEEVSTHIGDKRYRRAEVLTPLTRTP
jgi:hypothetical protein